MAMSVGGDGDEGTISAINTTPSEPPKVVQIAIAADGAIRWDGASVADRRELDSSR
jgi:hypothetical protein